MPRFFASLRRRAVTPFPWLTGH